MKLKRGAAKIPGNLDELQDGHEVSCGKRVRTIYLCRRGHQNFQPRQVEDEIKACSTSDKMRLWWLGTQITTLLTKSWAGGESLILKMVELARGPERKDM